MTILTKPNVFVQIKKDIAKCPVADESILIEEEKVETYTPKPRPCSGLSMGLLMVLLSILGIYSGMYLFRRCLQQAPQHRYQGFCSIPIDTKQLQESQLIEPNYRMMPLRWSSSGDPDVQVLTDTASDDFLDILREELDIGDTVEKITVYDNGRQTSFIHDFGANMTGIVDAERCFTMELDPALVLAPDAFLLSIEAGGSFDVTRVRSALRALLPALAHALPDHCRDKPVYRLQPDVSAIRKRSAEIPAHYIQFSGRRVQEIEISNLDELLRHEQGN